jgi:predicted short-subunit dehydrogenase-like oxidoreductase (DUF2520 family)
MRQSKSDKPGVALVGAGRLARAFIPALHAARYPILTIADRTIAAARRACRLAPGCSATRDAESAVPSADLILLAVPDGAIGPLAAGLAENADLHWRGKVVLHHAGALGPQELEPLGRRGTAVGVLHPLQSLGDSPLASTLLRGSRARIEGQPKARAAARRLARDLGMVPLSLDAPLSTEERTIYHAAAAMVSNDLIALLDAGCGLLEHLGMSRRSALEALGPLARGTLQQAEGSGFRAALTGPVARGDIDTVAAHLRVLGRHRRGSERIHRILSRQLLSLAEREEAAPSPQTVRRLKKLLRDSDGGRRRSLKL